MYFELQLSDDVFTRIVRNRMRAAPMCVNETFLDVDGTLLVVDRVEIGDLTSIQRERSVDASGGVERTVPHSSQLVWRFSPSSLSTITVPFLQVRQNVVISLVKASDLDTNGASPTSAFRTVIVNVVVNVSLAPTTPGQQGGGPLRLSYAVAYVEFGLFFALFSEQQRATITQKLSGIQVQPITLDLGPVSAVMGRPVNAINAGIACDPDGTFVSLRADIDVHASELAIARPFFEDGPTNWLAGGDWAMLLDVNLLTQDGARRAKSVLTNVPKLALVSGPTVSWDAGGAALDISAALELADACPFFIDDIDMDVDVAIRASFSAPTPTTLRTRFHVTGTPSNEAEKFACAVTGALLWPFLGPVMLKDLDLDEGLAFYLAGLAAGPLFFLGILGYIESTKPDIAAGSLGPNCRKVDDENIECDQPVDIRMMLIPPFNARLNLDVVHGLPEGLVLGGKIVNLGDAPVGDVEVAVRPFAWTLIGGCRPIGSPGFRIANQAEIDVTAVFRPGFPVQDASICTAFILEGSDPLGEFKLVRADAKLTVIPQFKPEYLAAPYPCRIRVVLSRGRGVRTITLAPAALLTDAQREMLEERRRNFVIVCQKWGDTFRKREWIDFVVPGPVEREFIQFWQIAVYGLNTADVIRVETRERASILSARPSAAGVVHMSMMMAGTDAPAGVALELDGYREPGDPTRAMMVQQVRFERVASLPVHGRLRAMYFERDAHRQRLIIADGRSEVTWDVTLPQAPLFTSSTPYRATSDADPIVVHAGKRVGAEPTRNLRRALQRFRDQGGCIAAVGSPDVGGIEETLYVRTETSATLYDITAPGDPRVIQTYESPAWFEGVALGGKLMAKLDARSSAVVLYASTGSHLQ